VGVYHAFANYSRFRQRDMEAMVIRGELAEARLEERTWRCFVMAPDCA
jgi:hypothetical protein